VIDYLKNIKGSINVAFAKDLPSNLETKQMNLYQAINNAMDIALATDST
jgi:hypothetical protein